MDDKKLTINLTKLNEMYVELIKSGGPENNGDLFNEMLAFEESVLNEYNLKPTQKNLGIIRAITEYENVTDSIFPISTLLSQAEKDDNEENLAPMEILVKGIMSEESPFDILTKMDLDTHEYFLFLCQLGAHENTEIVNIFNSMVRAKDFLSSISKLKFDFQELKNRNIQYLGPYLVTPTEDIENLSSKKIGIFQHDEEGLEKNVDDDAEDSFQGEMLGRIIDFTQKENEPGYVVRIIMVPEHEYKQVQNRDESVKDKDLNFNLYSIEIINHGESYSMKPDEELRECMRIRHENNNSDHLNPALGMKWKAGYLAEKITAQLIESGLMQRWFTS